jgi:predicted glycogen debranching enzyme
MSYLRFDKYLMNNLEESLTMEILRTNMSGAYHCTTVVDCNTRKYHGLLVIPVPTLDDENHVLLSSLDETVVQHGAEFNLGLHRYHGGNYSPNGHKYIREFDCEIIPRTTYRVGGVVLTKEKIFIHHENRILIRYTLLDAHSPTTIRLRPFLAFRSVREYTHENATASREYQAVENGIRTRMYDGYPELVMQLNKTNEFHFAPDWYRGFEYTKELERGYLFDEDLYVPGYFEFPIRKGESVLFSAGVSETTPQRLKRMFDGAIANRTPRDSFYNCLKNSAHQFLNRQGDDYYFLAGYPWFKVRARDMFVSLPGLTLAIGEPDIFEKVMTTAKRAMYAYMRGEATDPCISELQHPDVPFWAIWAIQQYAKEMGRDRCRERYGTLIGDILQYIRNRKHANLFVHDNGLLFTDGSMEAVTWMNSTVGGKPVVPRTGYIVEINALWYNALRFAADLLGEGGQTALAEELNEQADRTGQTFVAVFRNEYGYLFDYVNGFYMDWSVRPNMLFAIALDYSPLNKEEKKQVLDIVTKELLTPKGIRSLSPKSGGYNPNYVGTQTERDYAYHQGTAWPWLMGFYLEAYLRTSKMSGLSFVERQLIGFEEEITRHCIGTISELFDGNPPFRGRGAISFAMNVAEILRILKLLSKYNP